MSWQPDKDAFTFIFDAMSHLLYNLLGFLAPFQLLGRQMLQRSMTSNIGWDSPLDEDLRKEFQREDSIPQLAEYTIARWWNSPKQVKIVHEWSHILADASSRGCVLLGGRRIRKHLRHHPHRMKSHGPQKRVKSFPPRFSTTSRTRSCYQSTAAEALPPGGPQTKTRQLHHLGGF